MTSRVKVTVSVEVVGQYQQSGRFFVEATAEVGEGANPLFVARQFDKAHMAVCDDLRSVLVGKFGDIGDDDAKTIWGHTILGHTDAKT